MMQRYKTFALSAAALLAVGALPTQAGTFGTECQSAYQSGWQVTLGSAWDHCANFNDEMNDFAGQSFYFNLHGEKPFWEGTSDQSRLETVDLFYSETHGGVGTINNAPASVWAMWNNGALAVSTNMRLGNEAHKLSLFATYSCKTLKYSDDKLWKRMGPIFKGGLRYAFGSHDLFYDGWTTDDVGADFADNMDDGDTLAAAWEDGAWDWWADNARAVMATGKNKADCTIRREFMQWQTFPQFQRLRDGDIGWYCYHAWN